MVKQKSLDNFTEEVNIGDLVRFEINDPNFTTEYTGYAWGSPQVTFDGLNIFHHTIEGVDYVIGNVPPEKVPTRFPLSLIPIDFRNRRIGDLTIVSYEVLPPIKSP